ncbi:MAG: MBL fold metallo-hydrolase [Dehalococcoidia bacterium]|nr:MBL fold metallo-hydrolase [Dehalococcoidia bacterium]
MEIRLTFRGAAQTVTGSQYLVETDGARFLVDCGLYEERQFKGRNWESFPFPPESLDAVLLTHAHLDHSGLLPRLARGGFQGAIYATPATAEIAEIMLLDSAHIQQEDAEFKKRRHEREGRKGPHPEVPLYTTDDANATIPLFSPARYGEAVEIAKGVEATFCDAGHVLGSAMIRVKIRRNGEQRTMLFSGDIGKWRNPILRDPMLFDKADYVLVESTYGDRSLGLEEDNAGALADAINWAVKGGGNVVIPAFALERSQDVMYYLNQLLIQGRIPHLMVFLDSPMAVRITDVFVHHPELFDEEMLELLRKKTSPFDFPGLHLVRSVEQSKAINHVAGTVIIIAGSGMATGGRIKHHLVSNISRAESTILFVGYQAMGTLGRQIVDGAEEVRILGQTYPVRARVMSLPGFSSHSDQHGLLRWIDGFKGPPRNLFVTHGEPVAAQNLAGLVRAKTGWTATVPQYKDLEILD